LMPGCAGDCVSYSEVEHAMGSCGALGAVPVRICYGGNCMAGGCGCRMANPVIAGKYVILPANPCYTSIICTMPQAVDYSKTCAGS